MALVVLRVAPVFISVTLALDGGLCSQVPQLCMGGFPHGDV